MSTSTWLGLCLVVTGCSSSAAAPDESAVDDTGDAAGMGGSQATGGGGAKATGGSSGGGGAKATGGSSGGGGAKATGGSSGASGKDAATGTGGAGPTDSGTSSDAGRPQIGDTGANGRKLVWSDEFDGPDIDRAVWGNETGFVRNGELQKYTTDAANQFIDQGDLVIKGIYVGGSGQGAYTSASLITKGKKTFQYGRIESRIKVPGAKGSWPAFWLLPPNKPWPAGGEIDIMEWISQEPNVAHGTAHFAVNTVHQSSGSTTTLASPVPSDYHVFAIEWTATAIDWYVDTTHYHTYDTTQIIDGMPFQAPFYFILNYAIGGSWPEAPDSTQYPSEMRVDWVRVWQ
jgi:beta-glucanase (GH16 family)